MVRPLLNGDFICFGELFVLGPVVNVVLINHAKPAVLGVVLDRQVFSIDCDVLEFALALKKKDVFDWYQQQVAIAVHFF